LDDETCRLEPIANRSEQRVTYASSIDRHRCDRNGRLRSRAPYRIEVRTPGRARHLSWERPHSSSPASTTPLASPRM
jgi:hypothetical protein